MTAIPAPWAALMDKAGITSIRELAKAAGLPSHNIINPVIMKGTKTADENMVKVAAALRVPVEELYRISSGVAARPLSLPIGTEKLSERQKNAVAELIRTMIEEKTDAGFVDKKSADPAEPDQEKTATVTPIGGRGKLTPAQLKFEDSGRKVARIKRDVAQDSLSFDADPENLVE